MTDTWADGKVGTASHMAGTAEACATSASLALAIQKPLWRKPVLTVYAVEDAKVGSNVQFDHYPASS